MLRLTTVGFIFSRSFGLHECLSCKGKKKVRISNFVRSGERLLNTQRIHLINFGAASQSSFKSNNMLTNNNEKKVLKN